MISELWTFQAYEHPRFPRGSTVNDTSRGCPYFGERVHIKMLFSHFLVGFVPLFVQDHFY